MSRTNVSVNVEQVISCCKKEYGNINVESIIIAISNIETSATGNETIRLPEHVRSQFHPGRG